MKKRKFIIWDIYLIKLLKYYLLLMTKFNINYENILSQLVNFSLLSYRDGFKTLIKECKLIKEIKIKIKNLKIIIIR